MPCLRSSGDDYGNDYDDEDYYCNNDVRERKMSITLCSFWYSASLRNVLCTLREHLQVQSGRWVLQSCNTSDYADINFAGHCLLQQKTKHG